MNKSYGEMLQEWAGRSGGAVIVHENSEPWKLWMLYFHQFQMKWIFPLIEGKRTWTVPTLHPGDFDNRFNPDIGQRNMANSAPRVFSMADVRARGMDL